MQHLFLTPPQFQGEIATITGPEHLHLARVMRARIGDNVVLLDGTGNAFRAVLVSIERNETRARLEEPFPIPPEPSPYLTVAQALGKGDKFEQVIQRGTEAGASAFVPVRAERCVADVPPAKVVERTARWQQIAKSAAEQSGRAMVPKVAEPQSFAQFLKSMREHGEPPPVVLLLHPDASAQPLSQVLRSMGQSRNTIQALVLAVGPEGGWSGGEVSQAQAANIPLVTLGPHVLRTETAALVAISQILYHFTD